mgnify:CR=1 FL=1
MTVTAHDLSSVSETGSRGRGKWKGPAATLGPGMIILLLFFVVPISLVTVYSFLSRDTYGGVVWSFTLDGYERLIGVPNPDELRDNWDFVYLSIILKSAILAAFTAILALLVGYPAAFFIARCNHRQKYFLLFLVTVPFFANALIRMYAWILILRSDGIINNTLIYLGIISQPIQIIYTPIAVSVAMLYQYLPFMVLPLFASIEKLDNTLVEASLDLGAKRSTTFWRIVLPLTWPGVVAGLVLVFVPAMGNFVAPTLIGGGKDLYLSTLLAQSFLLARDWPFGSAIATFFSIIVVLSLLALALTGRRAAALGEPS